MRCGLIIVGGCWGSREERRAYRLELPSTVRHFEVLVNQWSGEGPA